MFLDTRNLIAAISLTLNAANGSFKVDLRFSKKKTIFQVIFLSIWVYDVFLFKLFLLA